MASNIKQRLLQKISPYFGVLEAQSIEEPIITIGHVSMLTLSTFLFSLISEETVHNAISFAYKHCVNDWEWVALCFAAPISKETFDNLPNHCLNSYVCKDTCDDIGKLSKFNMRLVTHHVNNNLNSLIESMCKYNNVSLLKILFEKYNLTLDNISIIETNIIDYDFAEGFQYLYETEHHDIFMNILGKIFEFDLLNCLKLCINNNWISSYNDAFKLACSKYSWNCATYLFNHMDITPEFDLYLVLSRDRGLGLFKALRKKDTRANFQFVYENAANEAVIYNQHLFAKYIFIEQQVPITKYHLIDLLHYRHLDIFKMLYIHIKEHPEVPHEDVDDIHFLKFVFDNDYVEGLKFLCNYNEPNEWMKSYASSCKADKCNAWLLNN
jgi:hypothetical protein